MKKNKKKLLSKQLLITGILITLVPLFINKLTPLRLCITLVGLIIITLSLKQKIIKKNIIVFISLLIVSVFIDSIISITFIRIPVYTYNIITINKTRVYNALGYRIWQCDIKSTKNMKIDQFYTKGYLCDANNIEQIDSNSFLNSVIENYEDYKNTYVKIRGKISRKNSQNSIEMQPYEETSITINGYVNFADNITLKIMFKKNVNELDLYDIYDEITVIGVVKTLEHNNDKFIIYLTEAEFVSEESFDSYQIIVNKENTCRQENIILYSSEGNTLYSYCLDDIVISYGQNKYELASALSSSKITIESLFVNSISKEVYENDKALYKFNNYNILECKNDTNRVIIIGPNDMESNSTTCSSDEG